MIEPGQIEKGLESLEQLAAAAAKLAAVADVVVPVAKKIDDVIEAAGGVEGIRQKLQLLKVFSLFKK